MKFEDKDNEEGHKRARSIEHKIRLGIADKDDLEWLAECARGYFRIREIAENSWIRSQVEIFVLTTELEDLTRHREDGSL